MMHTARRSAGGSLEGGLGIRCPTCSADPGAHCSGPAPAGTPNRPTATPEPNRPERTLDHD